MGEHLTVELNEGIQEYFATMKVLQMIIFYTTCNVSNIFMVLLIATLKCTTVAGYRTVAMVTLQTFKIWKKIWYGCTK